MAHVSLNAGVEALRKAAEPYAGVFRHGSLAIELYQPDTVDTQTPHDRDEVYVVISGSGTFMCDNARSAFGSGDLLFVPANTIYRFENFSDDFQTWVIFYGPVGGESAET